MTRREVLRRGAVLGIGAAGLGAVLGSPSTAGAATKLDSSAVLNFLMSTTIPGFDPQKWWNGAAACGQIVVFETLLTLNPYTSNSLTPTLATGMPKIDKGNTRFTYKLRPGVKFSDGTPLTSADVKYSFERLVLPSFAS